MEMRRGTMLKATGSTPPHPLAGDMVPLTLFDRASLDLYVPVMLVYQAPAPSNEALKEGLRKTVAAYPRLAGRFAVDQRGRRYIHLNNEGVLLLEAAVDVDLASVLVDGSLVTGDNHAMYPTLPPPEEFIGAALMQIKLTRYRCGGLVIGLACHHQVIDGTAGAVFRKYWARAVREGTNFAAQPSPLAVDVSVPRDIRTPVFDHGSTEFKVARGELAPTPRRCNMKTVKLRFTAELVAELKARVGFPCTTFECLLAHMWKKATQARGLKPEEFTKVRVAVNCRERAQPPVSSEYFGNMVLWAFPRLQARDVLSFTYGRVVSTIRDAVARIDAEYIRSFLDYGALADAQGLELKATASAAGTMCCPDLEVYSWLGFGHSQLDFGGGPPCLLMVPDIPIEGIMVFVPRIGTDNKGGVDVSIAVADYHAAAFHQICYSSDTGPVVSRL